MKMIFRCEWIKTSAGHKAKADENGVYLRSENGRYLYEKCERFTVRLIPVGFATRVGALTDPSVHENARVWVECHGPVGQILLESISAEAAAMFKVGEKYCFDPAPVTTTD